jgi:hypothetical protein
MQQNRQELTEAVANQLVGLLKHRHRMFKTAFTTNGWLYQCSDCHHYEIVIGMLRGYKGERQNGITG